MDFRRQMKQLLRMCGHAMVSTVHERLDNVDRQIERILDQDIELAQNQTALLRSAVHLVQSLPQMQTEVQQVEMRLASLVRDPCVAKRDLEAAGGQREIIRREFNHAFTNMAAENARALAGHLEGLQWRLDDAVDNTQLLREEIENTTQRFESAANNLPATNAPAVHPEIESKWQRFDNVFTNMAAEDAQALAGRLESLGVRLDDAVSQALGLREEIESLRQRLDQARNNLAAANAEAQETGLAVLRPTLAGMLSLEREHAATRDGIAVLEPVARETRSFLANETVRQVRVETSEYSPVNPELGLMSFLYSHLPGRNALDIGAHIGEVSNCLLNTGYEVYAFEPYPPSYARLTERLKERKAFHPFNLALGAVDGQRPLYLVTDSTNDRRYDDPTVFHTLARHGMPEGLSFHETMPVPVTRLSDLHRRGLVPADISLVSIDTGGYDLEVIRGMDDHRYPVVCVEFWDTQSPFAGNELLYTLESIVREMGRRSYFWYIVVYRVWGQDQAAFFCNHDWPVPGSSGNVFFFRDHDTFQQAQQWCAAVLPRTYFKSVPASQATTQ
jgi:FkbM family methyltransferase